MIPLETPHIAASTGRVCKENITIYLKFITGKSLKISALYRICQHFHYEPQLSGAFNFFFKKRFSNQTYICSFPSFSFFIGEEI